MRSFIQSSFWSFITIASRTLSVLVINKIIALQFGPHGITLLAHFQNLISIVITIPSDGINRGVVTYLAGKETTHPQYRLYFLAGIWWQFAVLAVIIPGFLLQRNFFLASFFRGVDPTEWLYFFFGGLCLLLISIYLQAILLARQALAWYAGLVSFASLCSALLIWVLLQKFALAHLLLLFLFSQGFAAGIAAVLIWKKGWFPRLSGKLMHAAALQDIGKFILMALTLLVCSNLVNFYVREQMMQRFDLYQTGLWQAAVKLSDNYTMVFTSFIGMVYYPKLAALVQRPIAFRAFVRSTFFTLVPLVGAGLLVFYGLRRWFILLLFDKDFLPAATLLDYQVLGDFFKMSAWILSYIILAQGKVYFNMLIQVSGAGLYLLLLFWFVHSFGLEGVTMAHCVSFGLFFLFNLLYFRKLVF